MGPQPIPPLWKCWRSRSTTLAASTASQAQDRDLDDNAKPAQAANNLRKLAGDDQALAVAGPLTSSACEVTFPVANQMQIVSTSQASSKPGVAKANRPWAFRDTVDEGILARTSVPYFKKTFNAKSVAVIYDAKDAVSTAIATKIMPKVFADNGIEVLNAKDAVSFNTGDLDVSAQVTKLKSLNPDGVVIGADYSQAVTVLREMKRQGMDKPVIGGTPLISSAILNAAPEIPIVAPATFYSTMKTPKAEKFVAELQPLLRKTASLPADIEPSMYDANIYEIVSMYIDAVKKSGISGKAPDLEVDRAKIRDYMTNLKGFEGFQRTDRLQCRWRRGESLLHRARTEGRLGHQGHGLQRRRRLLI